MRYVRPLELSICEWVLVHLWLRMMLGCDRWAGIPVIEVRKSSTANQFAEVVYLALSIMSLPSNPYLSYCGLGTRVVQLGNVFTFLLV